MDSLGFEALDERSPVSASLFNQFVYAKLPFGSLQLYDDVLTSVCAISDINSSLTLLVGKIRTEDLIFLLQNLFDPCTAVGSLPSRVQQPQMSEKMFLKYLFLLVGINKVLEIPDDFQAD